MPITSQTHHRRGVLSVATRAVATLLLAAGLFAVPVPVVGDFFADCAEAQGHINVTIVIDPGTVGGAPRGVEATCVSVPAGSTGADVLAERARQLGRAQPRYDSSGLLCAIDGYPASGCGEHVSGGYEYWSYWTSRTGDWRHSSQGPAFRRMQDGDVEGWRFVRGSGGPSDPAPRRAPSSACSQGSSGGSGSGSSQPSGGGSGGSGGSTPSGPAPTAPAPAPTAPPAPAAPVGPSGGQSSGSGDSGDDEADPDSDDGSEARERRAASAGAAGDSDEHPSDGRRGPGTHPTDGRDGGDDLESTELAVAADDDGAAGALAVVLTLGLALGLGTSAVLRARRRRPA